MTPLAFGAPGKRLFGAYHAPEWACLRSVGVVLCAPVGWELIASHRSHRLLADRLAGCGFPVLRFDYSGTGDSPGQEADPGRLDAWLDSIGAAISELRRVAPVERVCLMGTRMGATLAGAFALRHPESVAGLVMWAPLLTGQSFLRENQAYRLLNNQKSVGRPAGEEEAAGFLITRECAAELAGLDLLDGHYPSAPALILARDDQSSEESLEHYLASQAVPVNLMRVPGLATMLQEPRKSVVPQEIFGAIESWMDRTFPELPGAASCKFAPPFSESATAVIEHDGIREEAAYFGRESRLFGLVTEPLARSDRKRPALVWLNTGGDHRVGPNRQYVTLARELARKGYTSLRFDPRGVGDGPVSDPERVHPYSRERIDDARQALDWFARRAGTGRFVLIGLCSAAHVAFHLGHSDPRVVGEILINPQTFLWKEGDSMDLVFQSTRAYRRKLGSARTWRRGLTGRINFRGIARALGNRTRKRGMARLRRMFGIRAGKEFEVRGAFVDTLRRGTPITLILGEDDSGLDCTQLHLGVGARTLRGEHGFRLEIIPEVDHTFSQAWAKELLAARVIRAIEHPVAAGRARPFAGWSVRGDQWARTLLQLIALLSVPLS